jgi:hypothetical protein
MLEEANVSDGPPVEHSIMKRAWPYALALAVVVTGCYLALVPLLRSLSPAPASSATSPLARVGNVMKIGKTKVISVVSPEHGKNTFVGLSPAKKTKKAKAKKSTTTTTTPATGFATNQPSTPTTPRTVVKTPKKPATTPTSTTKAAASKPKGATAVGGGSVDQTQVGGGGLATGGGDGGSSDFGQTSAVGP